MLVFKLTKLWLFSILLLTVSVVPTSAASKTVKLKITFVSATLDENNHVGNEWWWGGYINGKVVEEGSTVVLNLKTTDKIRLKAEAQEQDKYPDYGESNATIKVSSITKAIHKPLKVTVTENRGRYSGNIATWKFVFKVEKSS
ncbi:hypothetical protein SD71_09770 [Cohnella kolymensis]|uniref:Uncharacterized protein n=1 Tax=Cohnella kolymensis TaxID=1590652 RepID=A0ABR5A5C8_9BACL|nr:hypothetical protein [Cohnella kolymensis]KIL36219.1 hypothetical protein SD71_09770 [Cohnella kolymensis]